MLAADDFVIKTVAIERLHERSATLAIGTIAKLNGITAIKGRHDPAALQPR